MALAEAEDVGHIFVLCASDQMFVEDVFSFLHNFGCLFRRWLSSLLRFISRISCSDPIMGEDSYASTKVSNEHPCMCSIELSTGTKYPVMFAACLDTISVLKDYDRRLPNN